jgi:hypothetical protein
MRESLLRIQTEIIYSLMTGVMKLPDPMLAAVMGRLHDLARLTTTTDEEELVQRMAELEEFFRAGPPCSDALRSMIISARPSQMKSVIRGYLINYVYDL